MNASADTLINTISFITNATPRTATFDPSPSSLHTFSTLLDSGAEFAAVTLSRLSAGSPSSNVQQLSMMARSCPSLSRIELSDGGSDPRFACEDIVPALSGELRAVVFRGVKIRDGCPVALALSRLYSLVRLEFRGCLLLSVESLLRGEIWRTGTLRELRFDLCAIEDSGAIVLAKILPMMPNLESLRLHCNGIGKSGGIALGQALAKLPRLHTLDLSRNFLSGEGVVGVVHGILRSGAKLKSLDVSEVHICDSSQWGIAVAKLVAQSPQMARLGIAKNSLCEKAMHMLARSLSAVSDLDISSCYFNKQDFAAICRSLRTVHTLRTGSCFYGNYSARLAADEFLSAQGTIVSLDLGESGITAPGARMLSRGLARNGSLRSLRLSGNPLAVPGIGAIFHSMLESHHGWEKICVCGCRAGDEGAEFIANFLSAQCSLRRLCMDKNAIGIKGVTAMCDSLRNCMVGTLSIVRNPLGEEGVIAVAKRIVQEGVTVRKLNLEGTGALLSRGMMAVANAIEGRTEGSIMQGIRVTAYEWDGAEAFRALMAVRARARPRLEVTIINWKC